MSRHSKVEEVSKIIHTMDMEQVNEVIDHINDHPTHWVFVDGEMVSREEITSVNWDEIASVD